AKSAPSNAGVASSAIASSRVRSSPASGFSSASRSVSDAARARPEASSGMEIPSGSYRTGPDLSSRGGENRAGGEVGHDEVAGRAARVRGDRQSGVQRAYEAAGESEPEAEQAWWPIGRAAGDHVLRLDDQVGLEPGTRIPHLERSPARGRPC